MDFQNRTAEEILALLPPDEDDRWELKSATYLEPAKKGELKKELGKQVSAFANTGGGCIIFGVSDDTRQLEPCTDKVGRQSMVDFLSNLVEQSVEYPISKFQVYRIPFEKEPTKAIFLVQIPDSPAAPHQAKDERQYYYRIFGHSKPAPHFHLQLLRQRETKCIVVPTIESIEVTLPGLVRRGNTLTYDVVVAVLNQASFVAEPVGIAVHSSLPTSNWAIEDLKDGNTDHVLTADHLFPGLTNKFKFKITYTAPKEEALPVDTVASDMPNVKISIRAFSQNFGSDPIDLVLADYIPADELRRLNEENQKKIKDQKASLQKKFEEVRPELEAGMQEARRAMKQFPFITRPHGE